VPLNKVFLTAERLPAMDLVVFQIYALVNQQHRWAMGNAILNLLERQRRHNGRFLTQK
jgi:hypothetical protein